jgi:hypothetical protein
MNFDITLLKSFGLIFIFFLAFNLTGNCIEIKSQGNDMSDIAFFCQMDFLGKPDKCQPEKNIRALSNAEFHKEDKSLRRESQEKAKKKAKSNSESEQKKQTSLKSYDQLKGVLEEVDMMVSGWI